MMELKLKRVPKDYVPKKACVYVITHPEILQGHTRDIARMIGWNTRDKIYVGVTSGTIAQRWRDHKALRERDNQTTSRFIRDFGYDFEDCFAILFEGTEDQCYRMEYHLRPWPNMGLNQKIGGKLKHRKVNKHYTNAIVKASE